MIEERTMNEWVGFLGVPGTGKSTRALLHLIELGKKYGAYTIIVDEFGSVPDKWPNGAPTAIIRHANLSLLAKAFRENPNGLHAVETGDSQSVLDYANSISEATRKDGKVIPSIVMIDEAVSIQGGDPYRLSPEMRRLMAARRHKNTGLIWTTQSPQFIHYQFLQLCTRLYLFHMSHKRAFDNLREAGVSDAILQELSKLLDKEGKPLPGVCYIHPPVRAAALPETP